MEWGRRDILLAVMSPNHICVGAPWKRWWELEVVFEIGISSSVLLQNVTDKVIMLFLVVLLCFSVVSRRQAVQLWGVEVLFHFTLGVALVDNPLPSLLLDGGPQQIYEICPRPSANTLHLKRNVTHFTPSLSFKQADLTYLIVAWVDGKARQMQKIPHVKELWNTLSRWLILCVKGHVHTHRRIMVN